MKIPFIQIRLGQMFSFKHKTYTKISRHSAVSYDSHIEFNDWQLFTILR